MQIFMKVVKVWGAIKMYEFKSAPFYNTNKRSLGADRPVEKQEQKDNVAAALVKREREGVV